MPLPSKHRRQDVVNVTVEGFSEAEIVQVFDNQVLVVNCHQVQITLKFNLVNSKVPSSRMRFPMKTHTSLSVLAFRPHVHGK